MIRLCYRGHGYYQSQRCPRCEKARDLLRGTSTQRGYDKAHKQARAALRKTLPAPCDYGCGTWLEADGAWVAAHRVDGRPEYGWLASCRSCNELAKRGRKVQSL